MEVIEVTDPEMEIESEDILSVFKLLEAGRGAWARQAASLEDNLGSLTNEMTHTLQDMNKFLHRIEAKTLVYNKAKPDARSIAMALDEALTTDVSLCRELVGKVEQFVSLDSIVWNQNPVLANIVPIASLEKNPATKMKDTKNILPTPNDTRNLTDSTLGVHFSQLKGLSSELQDMLLRFNNVIEQHDNPEEYKAKQLAQKKADEHERLLHEKKVLVKSEVAQVTPSPVEEHLKTPLPDELHSAASTHHSKKDVVDIWEKSQGWVEGTSFFGEDDISTASRDLSEVNSDSEVQSLPSVTNKKSAMQFLLSYYGELTSFNQISVIRKGPNSIEYLYHCKVSTLTAEGRGKVELKAKQHSALNMLKLIFKCQEAGKLPEAVQKMSQQQLIAVQPILTEVENYEALLRELCSRHRTRLPIYSTIVSGITVVIQCKAMGCISTGSGKSARVAKKKAARVIWQELKKKEDALLESNKNENLII